MKFGICISSIIPIRLHPQHQSEMINQMLFGELCKIISIEGIWLNINLIHDGYAGWVNKNQIQIIPESEFKRLSLIDPYYSLDLVHKIKDKTNHKSFPIIIGSTLYAERMKRFNLNGNDYLYEGTQSEPLKSVNRDQIIENSYHYLHAPYLWGGRSPFGIDCSGLVQMAYKLSGVNIYRDTKQQVNQGDIISFLSEAKKGDLAFFDNDQKEIIHVGLIISGRSIIHASSSVRIDPIDHIGIYNCEQGCYTHHLRIIKSLI